MTIACSEAGSVRLIRSKGNASGRVALQQIQLPTAKGGAVSGAGRRPKRYGGYGSSWRIEFTLRNIKSAMEQRLLARLLKC